MSGARRGRRTSIAAIAAAVLSQSGCSAIVDRPSTASVVADVGLAAAVLVTAPSIECHVGARSGEGCLSPNILLAVVAAPILLGTLVASGVAYEKDADGAARPTTAPPTDPETARLARQAWAAAARGQCVAARATLDQIAARDADYHIAILADGVLGACP